LGRRNDFFFRGRRFAAAPEEGKIESGSKRSPRNKKGKEVRGQAKPPCAAALKGGACGRGSISEGAHGGADTGMNDWFDSILFPMRENKISGKPTEKHRKSRQTRMIVFENPCLLLSENPRYS